MVSKNNLKMRHYVINSTKQRFGLQKLNIGLTSVLLGLAWTCTGTASADEVNVSTNENAETQLQTDSTCQSDQQAVVLSTTPETDDTSVEGQSTSPQAVADVVNITGGESHRWDIHPVTPGEPTDPDIPDVPTPEDPNIPDTPDDADVPVDPDDAADSSGTEVKVGVDSPETADDGEDNIDVPTVTDEQIAVWLANAIDQETGWRPLVESETDEVQRQSSSTNQQQSELPQTSNQRATWISSLLGAALMILTFGLARRRKLSIS